MMQSPVRNCFPAANACHFQFRPSSSHEGDEGKGMRITLSSMECESERDSLCTSSPTNLPFIPSYDYQTQSFRELRILKMLTRYYANPTVRIETILKKTDESHFKKG